MYVDDADQASSRIKKQESAILEVVAWFVGRCLLIVVIKTVDSSSLSDSKCRSSRLVVKMAVSFQCHLAEV